jgi:hypothetical protein
MNATGGTHTPSWPDGGQPWGGLYNGMVQPFLNMTIKGALWYQVLPLFLLLWKQNSAFKNRSLLCLHVYGIMLYTSVYDV